MSKQYDDYLKEHRANVLRAFQFMAANTAFYNDMLVRYPNIYEQILVHDESKLSDAEYTAYDKHWYGSFVNQKTEREFDLAWLHHQKHNPHHWQYWLLIKDSGRVEPLDMPDNYIIEMLCDWSSFRFKDPQSTAVNWYNSNGHKMILSDRTKIRIAYYFEIFPYI